MLKKADYLTLPPQARRDALLSRKVAGENKPEAYLFSPAQPRARLDGRFTRVGYVEDLFTPRTQLGKGRVSARPGLGG